MKEIAFSEKLNDFIDSIHKETIDDHKEHSDLIKGELNESVLSD